MPGWVTLPPKADTSLNPAGGSFEDCLRAVPLAAWCSLLGGAAGEKPAVLSLSHRNVTCLVGSDPLQGAAPEQLVLVWPSRKD